jgi:L-ascorbate metabolism protein UlaG (beta-lactamase superfamily)
MGKKISGWISFTLIFLVLVFAGWYLSRPKMEEVGIAYATPSASLEPRVTVRWLGISTLLIDDGETQLMIDGYFSRPSLFDLMTRKALESDPDFIRQALAELKAERLSAVIPVHSHYDHAMDTATVAAVTGAVVLGSPSTANIARSSHLPEDQIWIAQTEKPYSFGNFSVTLYESKHAPLATNLGIDGVVSEPFSLPAPYTAWQLGQAYSIHIAHPEGRMLIQGSAGFVPGALESVRADVVFLGVGGLMAQPVEYRHEYISEMVTPLRPKLVIPIHHDDLFGNYGEVEQSPFLIEFDRASAFELQQSVRPAVLKQMRFSESVAVFAE